MDQLTEWPLPSLLLLDNEYCALFLDWVKDYPRLKDMVLFLLEADTKRFPDNRTTSVFEKMSKIKRILEHYFLSPGRDTSGKIVSPLLLPPKSFPNIIEHLTDIICHRQIPMFGLFSALCDSIWVDVLRQGSAIIGSAQYWPSIKKQLLAKDSFDLSQVLEQPELKTFFVKFLNLAVSASQNKDILCLQCFDVISMILSSVDELRHPTCRKRNRMQGLHSSNSDELDSTGTGGFTDPIQAFGVLVLDARTLYAQFFSDKRVNALATVAGVADSTKFELSSLLAATASVQGTIGSSRLDDDVLYSIDFNFALNHALLFEKCFQTIETECLSRLKTKYIQFQASTEYALMMAFVRSQNSVEVREYKSFITFVKDAVGSSGFKSWKAPGTQGCAYIRHKQPINSKEEKALPNFGKSPLPASIKRKELNILVIKAFIEVTNDIQVLTPDCKDWYDSDEISVSRMEIFGGDLASRFSEVGPGDELNGGNADFNLNETNSEAPPFILRKLDGIPLLSAWDTLGDDIKGNTKKPEWWLADLIRRQIKLFQLLSYSAASGAQISRETVLDCGEGAIGISFSHYKNQELFDFASSTRSRAQLSRKSKLSAWVSEADSSVQGSICLNPQNSGFDIVDEAHKGISCFQFAMSLSTSNQSLLQTLRSAAGCAAYADSIERYQISNSTESSLSEVTPLSSPRLVSVTQSRENKSRALSPIQTRNWAQPNPSKTSSDNASSNSASTSSKSKKKATFSFEKFEALPENSEATTSPSPSIPLMTSPLDAPCTTPMAMRSGSGQTTSVENDSDGSQSLFSLVVPNNSVIVQAQDHHADVTTTSESLSPAKVSSPQTSIREKLRQRREETLRRTTRGKPTDTSNSLPSSSETDAVLVHSTSELVSEAAQMSSASKSAAPVVPILEIGKISSSQNSAGKTTMATLRALANQIESNSPEVKPIKGIPIVAIARAPTEIEVTVTPSKILDSTLIVPVAATILRNPSRCADYNIGVSALDRLYGIQRQPQLSSHDLQERQPKRLELEQNPSLDFSIESVLSLLSPRLMVALYTLLLCNRSVVLLGRSPTELAKALDTLHAVTYPFQLSSTHNTRMLLSKTELAQWVKEVTGSTLAVAVEDTSSDEGSSVSDEDYDQSFNINFELRANVSPQPELGQRRNSTNSPFPAIDVGGRDAVTTEQNIAIDWFNSPVKHLVEQTGKPSSLLSTDPVGGSRRHSWSHEKGRIRPSIEKLGQRPRASPLLHQKCGNGSVAQSVISPAPTAKSQEGPPEEEWSSFTSANTRSSELEQLDSYVERNFDTNSLFSENEEQIESALRKGIDPHRNAIAESGPDRWLCGVLTPIFYSLDCLKSKAPDSSPKRDKLSLVSKAIVIDIDACQIVNTDDEHHVFESVCASTLLTKINQFLRQDCQEQGSESYRFGARSVDLDKILSGNNSIEGCTKDGATARLLGRLQQLVRTCSARRFEYASSAVNSSSPRRQRHDKISGGYLVNNDDQTNDGQGLWLADYEQEKSVYSYASCTSSRNGSCTIHITEPITLLADINSRWISCFQRFLTDVLFCCLPACVDQFYDNGIISCNVVQLLSSLQVKTVYLLSGEWHCISEDKEGSNHSSIVITNGCSGRDQQSITIQRYSRMSDLRGELAKCSFEDVFLGEVSDSPVFYNLIFRHGPIFDAMYSKN